VDLPDAGKPLSIVSFAMFFSFLLLIFLLILFSIHYTIIWRINMPIKDSEANKKYRKEYYQKNRDKLLSNAKDNHAKNRDRDLNRMKTRYENNKNEYKEAAKQWAKDNPEKRRDIENKYQREHKQIHRRIRGRIRSALHSSDACKSESTNMLIGCTIKQLKDHLQSTAIDNGYDFDINQYDTNKYHIDHIIPCAAFYLLCPYHQRLCFHYTNLQILEAQENRLKSDSFI
jgi:hemerythrin